MKKIAIFSILFVILSQFHPAADAVQKVRVTVDNANVRLQPSTASKVVLKAGRGDIFSVTGRDSGWFKVLLPAEAGADTPEGYINESVVEEVSGPETSAAPREKGAAAKPVSRSPRPPRTAPSPAHDEKLFSGFSAKFGLMTSPAASFGDRWLLAFSYDKGLHPFLTAGLELQPYFRHFADAELSDSTFGANLFLNAKGGVNIGRFTESLKFLTPYAGFGLGGAFAFSSSKFADEKVSRTNFNFAWHMMFGVEVALKKMSAILEFQILKISLPEIDPDPSQCFWMLGIRF